MTYLDALRHYFRVACQGILASFPFPYLGMGEEAKVKVTTEAITTPHLLSSSPARGEEGGTLCFGCKGRGRWDFGYSQQREKKVERCAMFARGEEGRKAQLNNRTILYFVGCVPRYWSNPAILLASQISPDFIIALA